MSIKGITVGTPIKRSDWNQTDPQKGDYIENKPNLAPLNSHLENNKNPHNVTAEQIGAVPVEAGTGNDGKFLRVVNGVATWTTVNSAEVGAVPVEAGAANEGKFLRVVNGAAAWVTVNSAEGGSF